MDYWRQWPIDWKLVEDSRAVLWFGPWGQAVTLCNVLPATPANNDPLLKILWLRQYWRLTLLKLTGYCDSELPQLVNWYRHLFVIGLCDYPMIAWNYLFPALLPVENCGLLPSIGRPSDQPLLRWLSITVIIYWTDIVVNDEDIDTFSTVTETDCYWLTLVLYYSPVETCASWTHSPLTLWLLCHCCEQ